MPSIEGFVVPVPIANKEAYRAMATKTRGQVFVAARSGWRWDGSGWTRSLDKPRTSLSGSGPNDVWAARDTVMHFDGTEWKDASQGPVFKRTGAQWRYLPHDLPDWRLVYHYFARWKKDGTWIARA